MPPHNLADAATFSGSVKEDPIQYTGLSNAKFNTPSGAITNPGYLSVAQSSYYSTSAYSLDKPQRIRDITTTSPQALPKGANEQLLTAMISYGKKFTLDEIAASTGIRVNERQLKEATQLAIWIHASSFQVDYQIDVNSVTDTAVRSLATEINTWASKQVSEVNSYDKVTKHIFPTFEPKLKTENATIDKTDTHVDYGPYSVDGQVGAKFTYQSTGGILLDASKKEVESVTSSQTFYVRYPATYNGDKIVGLIGNQTEYSMHYAGERLWLHQENKQSVVRFSLGGHTSNNGIIQITATDAVTNKPVKDLQVEVNTTSPVGVMQTNEKGTDRFDGSTGKYTLKFKAPQGYLTPEPMEVEIGFVGDIQIVNIKLQWSKAVVNFSAVDGQTLAPAGDSEALIYDKSGKAVKRIALNGGKAYGIALEEGDYNLVQYKSSNGYAINVGTPFTVKSGGVVDVTVVQDAGAMPTTFNIKGASNNTTWVYTISKGPKVLFKMNGAESLSIPLPVGEYNVKAVRTDGTSSTQVMNFKTALNSATMVDLKQSVGTETVNFNIVDANKKEPIPNVVLGLFDENHNLLQYQTADEKGGVTFSNVEKFSIFYVNVVAAPESVSGYSANGNRFMGDTRTFNLELYSAKEIKEITDVDTLYRVPNVTYTGVPYTYPE